MKSKRGWDRVEGTSSSYIHPLMECAADVNLRILTVQMGFYFVHTCDHGIVINLTVGILPHVDNFSHVGGFISGFLFGFMLLLCPRFGWLERDKMPEHPNMHVWNSNTSRMYWCYYFLLGKSFCYDKSHDELFFQKLLMMSVDFSLEIIHHVVI